jgi:hypothetical protein
VEKEEEFYHGDTEDREEGGAGLRGNGGEFSGRRNP